MDVLRVDYIPEGNVTLFDVRLSESEVVVFSDCLNYVLKHCSDEQVDQLTECSSKEELSYFLADLLGLMKSMEHKKYMPDRYKSLD
ncbi:MULTISPECIES: hypothetical protein [unclassified Serratia (in: enterobacteria)]|uniref:hypothetical protein n=1 Tax=unclassified Serratia (in: enterobacteria) TaxID=2647522 RepID=UPI000469D048|nr:MULTISPECIES: hypothetical protein [unclassified Serratia (in: enterobacteria)]